jgi:hypothetical protein
MDKIYQGNALFFLNWIPKAGSLREAQINEGRLNLELKAIACIPNKSSRLQLHQDLMHIQLLRHTIERGYYVYKNYSIFWKIMCHRQYQRIRCECRLVLFRSYS